MSKKLRSLAALAIVALIGAGCSDGSAENGTAGPATNNGTASNDRTATNTGAGRDKSATDQDKSTSRNLAGPPGPPSSMGAPSSAGAPGSPPSAEAPSSAGSPGAPWSG
jgi:hypothetical protein